MFKTIAKLIGLHRSVTPRSSSSTASGNSYTTRFGQTVRTDSVFDAWTSDSLPAMLQVIDEPTNLLDRHCLLHNIVRLTYKDRKKPELRDKCCETAELHLAELPEIVPALKKDMGGTLPHISTFQHYATLLTEDGEFDKAIEVCQQAITYGLSDGTKGDYAGRIERIRKKRG